VLRILQFKPKSGLNGASRRASLHLFRFGLEPVGSIRAGYRASMGPRTYIRGSRGLTSAEKGKGFKFLADSTLSEGLAIVIAVTQNRVGDPMRRLSSEC
jgi:hypothetical protein